MASLDKVLYTARVHTTGGRDGNSRSDDGRLQANLSSPGSSGSGTNPEQLFAAGYSACFIGALKAVAGRQKIALTKEVSITADVVALRSTAPCPYAHSMSNEHRIRRFLGSDGSHSPQSPLPSAPPTRGTPPDDPQPRMTAFIRLFSAEPFMTTSPEIAPWRRA